MRDPSSFNDFYAGCVQRVTGHVHAVTGNLGEAEDIVQEAFANPVDLTPAPPPSTTPAAARW